MPVPKNGAQPVPDVRRGAILAGVRRRHGAAWRDVARRQAKVAAGAATDFDAAGDPGMAAMLRSHAGILQDLAATVPTVRRKQAATPAALP